MPAPDVMTAPLSDADLHQLSTYDYPLPDDLIAAYPLDRRDGSRMMVVDRTAQTLAHQAFTDIVSLLNPGDVLVVNNTQVLPNRLRGWRTSPDGITHTGQVELLLLYPAHAQRPTGESASIPLAGTDWQVLMKPARKLVPGSIIHFEGTPTTFTVLHQGERGQGVVRINVQDADPSLSPMDWLARHGEMPIPPYFNRRADESDKTRYQTVYAAVPGAHAAPTAGLHFTPDVLQQLRNKGVIISEITLHVSAGTFREVFDDDITQHQMDAEYYYVPEDTVNAIHTAKVAGHRVVAVGTTALKTLETAARESDKPTDALLGAGGGWSELFIYPPFDFQVVDALLTNFHLPKSTLLMLVSAFSSRELMLQAYTTAVAQRYRFYSYGDCMLIQ